MILGTMRLILVAITLGLSAPEVRIDVLPRVMMAGASIRLTCRVTPHPDNRELSMGFTNWTESVRQLEGADAPIIHQITRGPVPCDPGEAYCRLKRTTEGIIAKTTIEVTCPAAGASRLR